MDEEESPNLRRKTDVIYLERRSELIKQLKETDVEQLADIMLQLEDDLSIALNKLRFTEITDPLTGAMTRRGFEEALESGIHLYEEKGITFSVLNLDLKRFKEINDTHGHEKGNEALREATRILKESLRSTDIVARDVETEEFNSSDTEKEVKPARVGGDEFLIILPGADQEEAQIVMDRILKTLQTEKDKLGVDHIVNLLNFSYGIEQWSQGMTKEGFLNDLDVRMYEQKRTDAPEESKPQ